MKNILIATDFSPASDNAMQYAARLASEFNAAITLLHVYKEPASLVVEPIKTVDTRSFIIDQLKFAAQSAGSGYSQKMNTLCVEGPAAATILQTAADINADLLVTGMKAGGKTFRKTFGSAILTLAKKTPIPMLVIPEEATYQPVNVIAIANERDMEQEENAGVLNVFRQVAQAFHSAVKIVHVNTGGDDERLAPFRLQKILGSIDPDYHSIIGTNVPGALADFIAQQKVDMLAVLPHEHTMMEKIFSTKNTRAMIFQTKIPLLVLPLMKQEKERRRNTRRVFRKKTT